MAEEVETTEETTLPPGVEEVEAFSRKTDRGCTFQVNFGENLEDAVNKFGGDVVFSIFTAKAVINSQQKARTVLHDEKKTIEEAVTAGAAYIPGITVRKKGVKKDPLKELVADVKSGKRSKEDLLAAIELALEED